MRRISVWRLTGRTCSGVAVIMAALTPVEGVGGLHTLAHSVQAVPGLVRIGDRLSHRHLNPISGSLSPINYELFARLVAVDERGRAVPDLLANIPSPSNHEILDGGKTVILKLKPHQYWSSGTEITSADIVFGWQVLKSMEGPGGCGDTCQGIQSVVSAGKYTARLRLNKVYAPVMTCCLPPPIPRKWSRLGKTPREAAATLSDTSFTYTDPSYWTSGPYQVVQFNEQTGRVVLARMKYYHVHPGPYVDRLIFSLYGPPESLATAAAQGREGITADFAAVDLPALLSHPGSYSIVLTPSTDVMTLQFNVLDSTYNGLPNPMRKVAVRQALALSLNRSQIARQALNVSPQSAHRLVAYSPFLVSGRVSQAGIIQKLTGAWDPIAHKRVVYSAEAVRDARLLLKRAGYANGVNIDLLADAQPRDPVPAFGAIQKDWAAIGVRARLAKYSAAGFPCQQPVLQQGRFEVYLSGKVGGPDPDSLRPYLDSAFVPRTNQVAGYCDDLNFSGIKNRQVDEGFRRGASTFSVVQRTHWYSRVQAAVTQNAYWVPLYYLPNVMTYDKHVRGVTGYTLSGFDMFGGYAWNTFGWRYVP